MNAEHSVTFQIPYKFEFYVWKFGQLCILDADLGLKWKLK